MITDQNFDRLRSAKASFVRLMIYTCIAGALAVIGALFYLSLDGPLTAGMVITTTVGVFVSIVLGAGLMALGFLSSNSGHDQSASGHSARHGSDGQK